jgi:hypothetical protein
MVPWSSALAISERVELLGVEADRTDVVVTTRGLVALQQIG